MKSLDVSFKALLQALCFVDKGLKFLGLVHCLGRLGESEQLFCLRGQGVQIVLKSAARLGDLGRAGCLFRDGLERSFDGCLGFGQIACSKAD